MDTNALLIAEQKLFLSVTDYQLLKNPEVEIRNFITVYIKNSEISSIMNEFNLCQTDLEKIYQHIFFHCKYNDLLYIKNTPCTYTTGLFLDIPYIMCIGARFKHNMQHKNQSRTANLLESAISVAELFFDMEAVQRNIISSEYFKTEYAAKKL